MLVPLLLDAGWRVRVVDRFFFGRERLPAHARLEALTLDSRRLGAEHLRGCEAVVDLAALSNDPSGELFAQATWAINHRARARCAALARGAGARRYLLTSSCSLYGFRPAGEVCDEASAVAPLTTYARANAAAEADILPLAREGFAVAVLRFATLFGLSPRMRFDLAVNGMTWGALADGRLPLMRDGTQWRPLLHVADAARAILFALDNDLGPERLLNVVGANVRLDDLARRVAAALPRAPQIVWYGDPDHRSYEVSAGRIAALGFAPRRTVEDGVAEIARAVAAGRVARTPDTLTLGWYQGLAAGGDPFALEAGGA